MMFISGPIFGKCFDNYKPRWLLIGGTFAHVFGLIMVSLSSEYYQFFPAQGCVSAIGASAIFYASMNSVGTWFTKRRAFAYGVMTSGSSLGGVVLPIIVMKLIPHIGFGWTMRVAAFTILGTMITANLTVKSRLSPKPMPLILMEFITPFKEMPFLLTVAGSWMFFFAMFLPFTYIILQAEQNGMSEDLSNYLLPILNAAR
jgi:MFS family permease